MEKQERDAIEILNLMCGNNGCIIADSGGKDSSVLKHIAIKARESYGVQFKIRHNHTTVDAPETVYFVREEQKKYRKAGIEYDIDMPKESMWQSIVRHCTPPTRLMRYCCMDFKEKNVIGEKLVTGVRKAESRARKNNHGVVTFPQPKKALREKIEENDDFITTVKGGIVIYNLDNAESRRIVESCYRTHKVLINPLLEWDDEFLWWYIRKEQIILNPLYGCGQCRVGCIGCPMAGDRRWEEFARYPKYKDAYIRAFDRMLIERTKRGLENKHGWTSGLKVFKWWMEDENMDGQLAFDEFGVVYEEYV